MGTVANLLAGPCIVLRDIAGTLTDAGFTKGGVRIRVTPQIYTFTTDQTGTTPARKALQGCEVQVSFSLAEYTLLNLKYAFANAAALQDDTTPSKKKVALMPNAGKVLTGTKWVIKRIDAATGVATTDKNLWATIPNGTFTAETVELLMNFDDTTLIPISIDCLPDETTGEQIFYGDETVVDANKSGF